jgi:hypothetical protein
MAGYRHVGMDACSGLKFSHKVSLIVSLMPLGTDNTPVLVVMKNPVFPTAGENH